MKTKCFSAETLNANVADLVIESPCLASLFEKNNVEYCCEGNIPLKKTLQKLKLSETDFLTQMNQAIGANPFAGLEAAIPKHGDRQFL